MVHFVAVTIRIIFTSLLLFAWFVPIFKLTIINRFGERGKVVRVPIVGVMLLKIFWPKSRITIFRKER